MTRTRQTARLSTGGTARRIQLGQPIVAPQPQADLPMRPAVATPDVQVSTHCIIKICEMSDAMISI